MQSPGHWFIDIGFLHQIVDSFLEMYYDPNKYIPWEVLKMKAKLNYNLNLVQLRRRLLFFWVLMCLTREESNFKIWVTKHWFRYYPFQINIKPEEEEEKWSTSTSFLWLLRFKMRNLNRKLHKLTIEIASLSLRSFFWSIDTHIYVRNVFVHAFDRELYCMVIYS